MLFKRVSKWNCSDYGNSIWLKNDLGWWCMRDTLNETVFEDFIKMNDIKKTVIPITQFGWCIFFYLNLFYSSGSNWKIIIDSDYIIYI